ncbi:NAD(P)-dependent oxidoreductase [Streptococcus hyointestinalis]|uniref:NAD(P)-dependent oxidoreductase n=1 Tax=Streptococcus hyointestinalis TaxID=1337 RepID=UPI001981B522|nr:NAD(P)-dependent oxidoreductase [Streptococcus hyointestinalis]
MEKDWVGNKTAIFKTLGAQGHSLEEREVNDYYATEPKATRLLLEKELFNHNVLEPACGQGHISKELSSWGYHVVSYDKIDRGFGKVGDFFEIKKWTGDIITNPPYKYALKFVEHALSIVGTGAKVAMFLKIQFLEGKARKHLFKENPPKVIYVASCRLNCAKNGEFDKYTSSAVCYAWYIWEKGYKGEPIIRWIN